MTSSETTPVLNPLGHSICFEYPRRLAPSGWVEHVPFGMLLVDLVRPSVLVELGTHTGVSYCAFCQAIDYLSLPTQSYAVDTWEGDPQAGYYGPEVLADLRAHHDPLYSSFSRLIQSTFRDALHHFPDGSIDLLHIDGFHTYDAVKEDFESWLPKMSDRSVVLLHDINVREDDFGVWQLWDELVPRYPHFAFLHGNGLGLVATGASPPPAVNTLLNAPPEMGPAIRSFCFALGRQITMLMEQTPHMSQREIIVEGLRAEVADLTAQLVDRQHDLDIRTAQVEELTRAAEHSQRLQDDAAEHIATLTHRLAASEGSITEMTARVAGWEDHWMRLETTKAWRAVKRWRHIQERVRSIRPGNLRTRPDVLSSLKVRGNDGVIGTDARGVLAEVEQATWDGILLTLEGWAVWPSSGSPPRFARFCTGDTVVGETRVHLSRPDIAARFHDISTARQCGFRWHGPVDVPGALDGCEEISIEFHDASGMGLRYTVPLQIKSRMQRVDVSVMRTLRSLLMKCEELTGSEPAVLDWNSNLDLVSALPDRTVFTPPRSNRDGILPYLDKSIDVVVTTAGHEYGNEARRVASTLVMVVGDSVENALGVEWQSEPVQSVIAPPSVSIVIPVHNNVNYTQACLTKVIETLPAAFRGEILVVDDNSTDETPRLLTQMAAQDERIRVLSNSSGVGFLHSCNRGATEATGDVLIFLNNDTLPQGDWIRPLVRILQSRSDAGAVGGKLVYPNGTLQEAGGVIFSDGSGYNFGKHDSATEAPLYSFVREVDYCSGALLATPRSLFEEIGGFDENFAPAYYEDVDYCFNVRMHAKRVYYQPESVIVHYEGASSGTDIRGGVKQFQAANQTKFVQKWRDILQLQPAPPLSIDADARHLWVVRESAAVR